MSQMWQLNLPFIAFTVVIIKVWGRIRRHKRRRQISLIVITGPRPIIAVLSFTTFLRWIGDFTVTPDSSNNNIPLLLRYVDNTPVGQCHRTRRSCQTRRRKQTKKNLTHSSFLSGCRETWCYLPLWQTKRHKSQVKLYFLFRLSTQFTQILNSVSLRGGTTLMNSGFCFFK